MTKTKSIIPKPSQRRRKVQKSGLSKRAREILDRVKAERERR